MLSFLRYPSFFWVATVNMVSLLVTSSPSSPWAEVRQTNNNTNKYIVEIYPGLGVSPSLKKCC